VWAVIALSSDVVKRHLAAAHVLLSRATWSCPHEQPLPFPRFTRIRALNLPYSPPPPPYPPALGPVILICLRARSCSKSLWRTSRERIKLSARFRMHIVLHDRAAEKRSLQPV